MAGARQTQAKTSERVAASPPPPSLPALTPLLPPRARTTLVLSICRAGTASCCTEIVRKQSFRCSGSTREKNDQYKNADNVGFSRVTLLERAKGVVVGTALLDSRG